MSALAVQSSAPVSAGARTPPVQVDDVTRRKIQKNAQEFEGILVRQMLRELRQSPFAPQGDIMSKSYQESADDQLAKHMVESGGLGFGKAMADLMLRQIQQSSLISSPSTSVKPSPTGAF